MLKRQGVFAILALIGVFVVLQLAFIPEGQTLRIAGTTMLGGIAFLLMTTAIVLSTRLSGFEDWFGGLDRMYQVHKMAGVIAALFVLIHFVAVPKELPEGVAGSTLPSAPLGMFAMVALILFLALSLNRKIAYHRWRPAHKLMGVMYLLVIGHFIFTPDALFETFRASGLMLVLAAIIGVVALGYSLFGMNRKTALAYKVATINPLERATEVVLEPVAERLSYKPGQFAFVEVKGKGWSEPHPFTISSAPDEPQLRFTVKVLGDWTRKLRDNGLEPGTEVLVRGPYGRFDSAASGKKQVWLAGGVGLTPFLSKTRDMKPGDPREVKMVYAARNPEDAIFLDELKAKAKALDNLTLVPLFSDQGDFAKVSVMKTKLPEALTEYEYFLCGPKQMTDAILSDLRKEGVARQAIHTEAFEFR